MDKWVTDNKGQGPWDFTPQPDKWGYLPDPRWQLTEQPTVSYTGRESEEPQIWTPEDQRKSVTGTAHNPCGHWHKASGGGREIFPPIDINSVVWLSCPQGVVTTNDYVYFLTTDDATPNNTIYIIRHDISTHINYLFHTEELPSNENIAEPQISVGSNGTYHIVFFDRLITTEGVGTTDGAYFILFNDDGVISNGYASIVDTFTSFHLFGNNVVIGADNSLNMLYCKYYPGVGRKYFFCRSTNFGTSWTQNQFLTYGSSAYPQLVKDNTNTLWFSDYNKTILYKSTDDGASWSLVSSTLPTSAYIICFGTKIVLLRRSGTTVYSYVSTDSGVNFTSYIITTLTGFFSIYGLVECGGNLVAMIFEYGSGTHQWHIYESADGISWTLNAQVDQTIDHDIPNLPFIGMAREDKIAFTGYYMNTAYDGGHSMSFCLSEDAGQNWTMYPTAFNKQV